MPDAKRLFDLTGKHAIVTAAGREPCLPIARSPAQDGVAERCRDLILGQESEPLHGRSP